MRSTLCVPVLLVVVSCARMAGSGNSTVTKATAPVRDATGREMGVLTVTQTDGGLLVTGMLRGLPPGTHGIHIHSVGQCAAPFTTAGGHWNPESRQHGFDNPLGAHAGDLQNIVASDDGTAPVRVTTHGGTLVGSNGLLDSDGAAIVVHAAADDFKTDPSGNSGARIACGVVSP